MTIEITPVTGDRLDAVTSMLGRAFIADPMVRWPFGDLVDGAELESRVKKMFDYLDEGIVGLEMLWEAAFAGGAALWVPPGQAERWVEVCGAARPLIDALTADGGRRYGILWDWIDAKTLEEPQWVLDHVGVEPAHQGSGIGSALIRFGLERARAGGSPVFLETGVERNVSYYERFGFRVVEHADAPGGGPHIWFMRWEP